MVVVGQGITYYVVPLMLPKKVKGFSDMWDSLPPTGCHGPLPHLAGSRTFSVAIVGHAKYHVISHFDSCRSPGGCSVLFSRKGRSLKKQPQILVVCRRSFFQFLP